MQSEESRLDDLIRLVAYVILSIWKLIHSSFPTWFKMSSCDISLGKDKKLSDPWRKMKIVKGFRQFI